MRKNFVLLAIALTALVASCKRHEAMPTGSYGDRVVSAQVVMASEMANGSPAGVEVSVVGTGMSATLAADGRFTFVGVPDDAQITFRRADSINTTARASEVAGLLQLGTTGLTKTTAKHRGTIPNDPGPSQQIEGTITNVATDGSTITVHDSHGKDDVIALTPTTLIRKGDKVVKPADLAKGDLVHVKASTVNNVLTASQVIVQDNDDDDGQNSNEMAAVGSVKSVGATSLVVTTKKGDITVNVDQNTVIMQDGKKITLADIKQGDQVAATGTKVDATTMLAKLVVDHSSTNQFMSVEGTVKSVGTSSLVVTTEHGDITVDTDPNTIVTRDGQKAALADIKPGDQVEAAGTKVNATTVLAKFIAARSASGSHD